MLKNYIKIAFRQLWKHKLFSAFNIFGLATSMAVCLLVIMILWDQYDYDTFHEQGNQIYRVTSAKAENQVPKRVEYATAPLVMANALNTDYTFVRQITRVMQIERPVEIEAKVFRREVTALAVDQDFLNMFSFDWTAGDQRTALLSPRSVVLTERTAKRFFPYKDPIGESIILTNLGSFKITGIVPDPPRRSHIDFDYLMSYTTLANFTEEERKLVQASEAYNQAQRGYIYLLAKQDTKQATIDKTLSDIGLAYSQRDENHEYLFQSQALDDIVPSDDLYNEIGGGTTPSVVLYFILSLGLVVIFSACFNYTNLSIARSLKRSKEIGVRKVIGAERRDIIVQFLGEAVLLSVLALLVAIGLLELLIPAFYKLDPFVEQVVYLTRSPNLYLFFLGFSLVVGLLAGIFPAFAISKFKPIQAIQQLANTKLVSRLGIRKVLVAIQFSLSLIFVLVVIIVLKQQQYILNYDFGIRTANMYNVRLMEVDYEKFAQQVRQVVGVEGVSASEIVPMTGSFLEDIIYFNEERDSMPIGYNIVSSNYIDNLDLSLIAGSNFPTTKNTKGEQYVLLNEMAVEKMGFDTPADALGENIRIDTLNLSVIGVTNNFHLVDPFFDGTDVFVMRQDVEQVRFANIRINESRLEEALAAIESIKKELSPNVSLYSFLTEEKAFNLASFFRMGSKIIGFVGLLTIIIACMGLLGMVIYSIEGRVKEVGIRKILGASDRQIIWQLSKSFLWLLLISIVFAVPLTLFGANLWLQNFVQRMTINPVIVLSGVTIIIIIGFITILSQAFLAARTNPVSSLRNE